MRSARLRGATALLCGLFGGSCTFNTNLRGPAPGAAALHSQDSREQASTTTLDEANSRCAVAEAARISSADVRSLLHDRSLEVRARAALAVGRISDAEAIADLGALLSSAGSDGALAAWALGRMPPAAAKHPDAESLLRDCLKTRCPASVAAARALGSAPRSADSLAVLSASLAGPAPVAAASGFSLGALARLGEKGADALVATAARTSLWIALRRPESDVRRAAAYALGRIPRGDPLEALQHASLLAALHDLDAETRATAARAAGKQGLDAEDLAPLLDPLSEPDWRVHVEAARALSDAVRGSALIAAAIGAAVERLRDSHSLADARWAHPLVQLFESATHLKVSRDALPAPRDLSAPSPAATAAIRCAAADARDRAASALLETPQCAVGLEAEWRSRFRTASLAAELAGDHTDSAAGLMLFKSLHDPDPRVRSAAAGAASLAFAPVLIALLDDSDPYVVGSAASTLAKDPAASRAALAPATRAAARFSLPPGPSAGDPRADTIAALATLFAASHEPPAATSSAASAPSEPSRPPVPPIAPEAALGRPGSGPRAHTLILTTSAGELRIHLFADDGQAPLTSVALSMLANRGFYDGLSFHRVVPDFVAQGGDPLGDGEGGPGFALPDEHSARTFTRGTLGIATSGPETGGSQFFLCHSAQPHLDGRYTIAGQLEGGEDVLDALQVGDVILHARAE